MRQTLVSTAAGPTPIGDGPNPRRTSLLVATDKPAQRRRAVIPSQPSTGSSFLVVTATLFRRPWQDDPTPRANARRSVSGPGPRGLLGCLGIWVFAMLGRHLCACLGCPSMRRRVTPSLRALTSHENKKKPRVRKATMGGQGRAQCARSCIIPHDNLRFVSCPCLAIIGMWAMWPASPPLLEDGRTESSSACHGHAVTLPSRSPVAPYPPHGVNKARILGAWSNAKKKP